MASSGSPGSMEKLLGGGDGTWAKRRRKTDRLGLWKEQQSVRVRVQWGTTTAFIPWLTRQWSVKLRSD